MLFLSGKLLEQCDKYYKSGNLSAIRIHLDRFLAGDKYLERRIFRENNSKAIAVSLPSGVDKVSPSVVYSTIVKCDNAPCLYVLIMHTN